MKHDDAGEIGKTIISSPIDASKSVNYLFARTLSLIVDHWSSAFCRQFGETPIKRHIKIKADANPYDPVWELYFEERLSRQMEHTLRGSRQLDYLWREQNGICPVCQQKLTDDTRWHNHHIVWRSRGGPDTADNRVLLHPNCHRQVHSQHLFVEKPRPSGGV